MEKCSVETVSLIFEYSCSEDFGKSARRLGLVSKYFRAIAEPIEVRTIAVSGVIQLELAVQRLDRVQSSRTSDDMELPSLPIRHLFISELTKEHAILADTDVGNGSDSERSCFWGTKEGQRAAMRYKAYTRRFWRVAGDLVRRSSYTLRTLSLLSMDNWFLWRGSSYLSNGTGSSKIIGALSGTTFPHLTSLTVNHDISSELQVFNGNDSVFLWSFRLPVAPALRRLHIAASIVKNGAIIHPFLAYPRHESQGLKELTLRSNDFVTFEDILRGVFGWNRVDPRPRSLPRQLKSVTLILGPLLGHGTDDNQVMDKTESLMDDVGCHAIPGLRACFPKFGEREYDMYLAEWKQQSLRDYLPKASSFQ